MTLPQSNSTIGVLASGGLDSCILIAHLLRQGHRVRPFHVRCELIWEEAELSGLMAFLRALDSPSSPLKKGGTAGQASSGTQTPGENSRKNTAGQASSGTQTPGENSRKNTAGQASSGTQTPGDQLFQQAARLEELVTLDLPLRDLYGRHWSVDGRNAPDAQTPAGAVYLPGRNVLLTIKPAIWCGMNGIGQLALAVLAGNPFADATDEFFRGLETTLEQATGNRVSIVRPFAKMEKREVLQMGRGLPLDLTFSCLSPDAGIHCGRCNKCAERQEAFRALEMHDPTEYAR